MEFSELLRRRRMVRNFSEEPVRRDLIERVVVRAVRAAPSAGFSQGVRLLIVTDPEVRSRIADLFGFEDELLPRGYAPWVRRAPVHVVVGLREDAYHERYREPRKLVDGQEIEWSVPWWWIDAGQAIMLLLLAAIDEGLGASLIDLYPAAESGRLRDALGFENDVKLVGIVVLGHPASDPIRQRMKDDLDLRRLPLDDVVRWEHWNGPA
jgi:nitroreductase